MSWLRRHRVRGRLASEGGYFEMAGNRVGLLPEEAARKFRDLLSADMDWADSRKNRFRRYASWIKILSLAFAGMSTVLLGIRELRFGATLALPLVAGVTFLGALEPFFNWRSRWVLMEETQYRLNRIRDELDYYLVSTPSVDISWDALQAFYEQQQAVWNQASSRWIGFRNPEGRTESIPRTVNGAPNTTEM